MAFGDSAGGLLEGFRMANSDLQAKHQQLMNDAISQAQQQHAQQELDQQKTESDNLNNYRTGQNYMQMLGQYKDYQNAGGTGAAFSAMLKPLGSSDKNIAAFLDSVKNQGQGQDYIDTRVAAKAKLTAEQQKAQNDQQNAMRKMYEEHFQYLTGPGKNVDVDTAKSESQALYPISGGAPNGTSGANTAPSSSVFPDDHHQLMNDAIAKASGSSPQTMQMQGQQPPQNSQVVPSPQALPPVNGGAAPPAPPSTGAGVPQSMVNPASQITGDQGQPPQGLPSPQPPAAPPEPITMVPTGLHGVLPGVALEQRAQEQKYQQNQLAMAIDAEKLREMPIEFSAKQKQDALKTIHETQDIANEKAQADRLQKLFPGVYNGQQIDNWSKVQDVKLRQADLAFRQTKDAADRADKINGKMTSGEITSAYTNARQLIDLKKDIASQLQQNYRAQTQAEWFLNEKNVPTPDKSDPTYAAVMQHKADAIAATTGAYNAETHKTMPSPIEASRNILTDSLAQAEDLYKKTQVILNQIGPQPTSDGGKPTTGMGQNYSRQNASGWTPPPGTIGNGKSKLLMPTKPGAKGLAKVSAPTIDSVAAKLGIK